MAGAPLAAPAIFNSLRLLFGIAFGYVMLAEVVKFGGDTGGLGDLINVSQRRGEREPILVVLVVIGCVLGIVRWRTDSLGASMVAHAVNNLPGAILILFAS